VQLFSQLSPTLFNEFQAGYTYNPIGAAPGAARMPSVTVSVDTATLTAGPGPSNQGGGSRGRSTEVGDYLVAQLSATHTLGFGAHVEFFRYNIESKFALTSRRGRGDWQSEV
jgi:hypothetical protein